MPLNRRNYYRLLHVQPDAPVSVIKAAYRVLVTEQQQQSGSPSALLREAYAVLADPVLRAAYDAKTAVRTRHTPLPDLLPHPGIIPVAPAQVAPAQVAPAQAAPVQAAAAWTPPAPAAPVAPPVQRPAGAPVAKPPGEPAPAVAAVECLMCRTANPGGRVPADARCRRCQAPLAPVRRDAPGDATPGNERRRKRRISREDWGTMVSPWNGSPIRVRLRDISAEGISVYTATPLAVGTRVRITADRFDLVASVVACRAVRHVYTVHGRVETVWVAPKAAPAASPSAPAATAPADRAGAQRSDVRPAAPGTGRRVS